MSNKINMGVSVLNEGTKQSGPLRQLTLERVSQWIKLQGFDEYTTEGLIAMAAKYPTQALPSFRKNFNLMIQRVRAQRKNERGQDANASAETSEVSCQEKIDKLQDFEAWESGCVLSETQVEDQVQEIKVARTSDKPAGLDQVFDSLMSAPPSEHRKFKPEEVRSGGKWQGGDSAEKLVDSEDGSED